MIPFRLDGKTVIVTGGAGLLGSEFAVALGSVGAKVVIADLHAEKAKMLAERVQNETSAQALGIGFDITDKSSVGEMVAETVLTFGTIDGLVNNAAINPKFDADAGQTHLTTFEDLSLKEWNDSLAVNITGMFLCIQAVAPTMLAQGNGSIINLSSTYGINAPDQRLYERDDPNEVPSIKPVTYTVTKSAVIGLTKYLAAYWGDKHIRVNTLTPGGVFNGHEEQFVRRYREYTPMRRMAEKHEYNGAVIFLLSDASSYMTGSNLVVDGGWTAW